MVKLALLDLPFDGNSSYLRGAARAPALIRKALYAASSNQWTENGTDLSGQSTFSEAAASRALEAPTVEEAFALLTDRVATLLEQGFSPIALGGDHSLTYPVVRAFARHYRRLNILHFDAHPDLYDEFEGNRLSHACPFARIMEQKLAARLMQVGIRTMNGHQREQAERFGVEVVQMRELREGLALKFDGPLYVTFDLDALDPAFAPAVSHHEPGGMSTRQAIALIQRLEAPQIVGADLVEYNPARDPQEFDLVSGNVVPKAATCPSMTAMAAAKILKEMAVRMLK